MNSHREPGDRATDPLQYLAERERRARKEMALARARFESQLQPLAWVRRHPKTAVLSVAGGAALAVGLRPDRNREVHRNGTHDPGTARPGTHSSDEQKGKEGSLGASLAGLVTSLALTWIRSLLSEPSAQQAK